MPNMRRAARTKPVSGDATHWGTVARQYKAGSKPVSEWRGNPLGDYAPIRLAALNEWHCYTRGGYAPM